MATGFCLVAHILMTPYILCDSPRFHLYLGKALPFLPPQFAHLEGGSRLPRRKLSALPAALAV